MAQKLGRIREETKKNVARFNKKISGASEAGRTITGRTQNRCDRRGKERDRKKTAVEVSRRVQESDKPVLQPGATRSLYANDMRQKPQ